MEALILSCGTGGGHNAAGYAVKEELERRRHRVTMLDPYSLAGGSLDRKVGNSYIKIAQRTPRVFGFIYQLGDLYRRLPVHSPVYSVNRAMRRKMQAHLGEHHYDVILMPHVFPGEILTYMKDKGIKLPKMIFIATDYTCIPFTEETNCDYYMIPSEELREEFSKRGIPAEKIISSGIPVKHEFTGEITRTEAIQKLGLDSKKRYFLLSGGSIGAGKIEEALGILCGYLDCHAECHLIAVCGNNQKLFYKLQKRYKGCSNITLLAGTDKMALYMKACDLFLSKPGGLSSTEAAVSGTPLIHISPIPGCETRNMEFFESRGMSIAVGTDFSRLLPAIELLRDPVCAGRMREKQQKYIHASSASDICDFTEKVVGHLELRA